MGRRTSGFSGPQARVARPRPLSLSVRPTTMQSRPESLNGVLIPYGVPASELEALVRNNPRDRWAALIALGHDSSSESLAALARAAKHPDPYVRRAGIEALALHVRGREARRLILDGLTDVSAVVVRAACETASALDLQDAHPRLLDLLRAAEPATREGALRALGSLWKAEDFE